MYLFILLTLCIFNFNFCHPPSKEMSVNYFWFIFNWRITALQHCVSFCHTSTWISHRYTHVSSLLNLPPTSHSIPPSRLSESTRCDLPASYSTFPLSTLHMLIFMFQYYSLNWSLPLLPPLCPQVCSLCLHLHCCPASRFISTIFLESIYMH